MNQRFQILKERNHMKLALVALAAFALAGCCAKAEISKPAPLPPLVSANPAFISVKTLEK
jgi:uncharacterized lipoprotein YajG